jgi:transcriptional regulator NrdR family protein
MDCPRCLARTSVKDTRKKETYNAWVNRFKKDWPDLVLRRRYCSACALRFNTVELPVDDLKTLIATPPVVVAPDCEGTCDDAVEPATESVS